MTIEFRPPRPGEEPILRSLFTEAFGDESFTNLFFDQGYSPERCLVAAGDSVQAALHWFDCTLETRKCAYLYGIATFASCRGRGIGSELIRFAIPYLQSRGYAVITLVPAEPSLVDYYERFGFRTASTIGWELIRAGQPIPLRPLSVAEYAAHRRKYLPANGIFQEGACLDVLAGFAELYATDHAVAAVSESSILELLGDPADAPGIFAALGRPGGRVRYPGDRRPFAMAIGTDAPIYLGLALD